jgi:fructosamine-3-kinase
MMRELLKRLSCIISKATHLPFEVIKASPVGGGSINLAFRLESADGRRYFLKLNDARHLPMFAAEAEGLEAMYATSSLRVPRVIAQGTEGRHCYLVLEYLELSSHGRAKQLGERFGSPASLLG